MNDKEKKANTNKTALTFSRRKVIKNGLSLGLLAASSKAPYVFAKKVPTLRVLGTHVTLQEDIRQQAMKDLGINLVFEPGGSAEVLQKASTRPESFDLYEQWSNSLNVLWRSNAIQAIDIERLTYWSEINALTKTGRITESAAYGKGDAPYKLLYVQKNGKLGKNKTEKISFLPYVHNVDSFGYNTTVVPEGSPYESESWSWLLDERWRGKVALINAPTIGLFDAALAAEAKGLMRFSDIGNMTRAEIDKLFEILINYKQQGHFAGFWTSVPQSVDFMVSKRVVIGSMFSPGVSSANGKGVPVVYAAPKEGYRAWHGVMCLSAKTQGREKDAAYAYMNWWLSGWAGAFIARQGYYISNAERSRPLLSNDEWNYWYNGGESKADLKGTDGRISVRAGATRRGGAYEERFSNIAVWNTVMNNYDYSLERWYEFLLA